MSARRSVTLRVSRLGRAKPPPEDERDGRESDAENKPQPRKRIERRLLGPARNPGGDREIADRGRGRGGSRVLASRGVARDRALGGCRRRGRHDVECRTRRRRRGRWRGVFLITLRRGGRRGRATSCGVQGGSPRVCGGGGSDGGVCAGGGKDRRTDARPNLLFLGRRRSESVPSPA